MKHLLLLVFAIASTATQSTNGLAIHSAETTRRRWLSDTAAILLPAASAATQFADAAIADQDENAYSNPNIPDAPEERSGLIVLRVAEVAQFQGEKLSCERPICMCTTHRPLCSAVLNAAHRENSTSNS